MNSKIDFTVAYSFSLEIRDLNAKGDYKIEWERQQCFGFQNQEGERLLELGVVPRLITGRTFPHKYIHKIIWYFQIDSPGTRETIMH